VSVLLTMTGPTARVASSPGNSDNFLPFTGPDWTVVQFACSNGLHVRFTWLPGKLLWTGLILNPGRDGSVTLHIKESLTGTRVISHEGHEFGRYPCDTDAVTTDAPIDWVAVVSRHEHGRSTVISL
jgi:hypothetical protein